MRLALSRQLFARHMSVLLRLCRNDIEKTKVDGHSYTCTLDRLEEEDIQPLSLCIWSLD